MPISSNSEEPKQEKTTPRKSKNAEVLFGQDAQESKPTQQQEPRRSFDEPFQERRERMDINYNFLQIDHKNHLIRTVPGVAQKEFLKLSRDFLISGSLDVNPGAVSVDGDPGTEATLRNYTIPLNTLSRNDSQNEAAGNVLRITASGRYTTDAGTETFALALKVGSTTYHTLTSTAATVTNAPWHLVWTIIIASVGASGTAESFVSAKINNVNKDAASTTTQTIDTTANQTISITATWTSGSAADDISIRTFLIELLN